MTDTTAEQPYGDPTDWDEIPGPWTDAFTEAIEALGHTVTEAHDTAITLAVDGLEAGEEWSLVKPNHHGMWAYGIYRRGYCPTPTWIVADACDPQEVAEVVHAILSGAPLRQCVLAGGLAVYPEPAKG